MVKGTERDDVWSIGMSEAISGNEITVDYVQNQLSNPPDEETIQDVLDTMTAHEWLQKQGNSWKAGPLLDDVHVVQGWIRSRLVRLI